MSPKSFADGSVATGRISFVRQLKGEVPDEARHKHFAFWLGRGQSKAKKKTQTRKNTYQNRITEPRFDETVQHNFLYMS